MSKIIILKGLPASGKSTWAKEEVRKDPTKTIRVNKDDLRQMLYNSEYSGKKEKLVLDIRDSLIKFGIDNKLKIIVDDTNLNPTHEENIKKLAERNGYMWEIKFFDVSPDICIERDSHSSGQARVGKDVILDMYSKYLKKESKPAFNPSLPDCVVVDMDGTLAINNHGRSFYDEEKAIHDALFEEVYNSVLGLVNICKGLHIVIVSGRDEGRGRDSTEQWLKKHQVPHTSLLMRPAGDTRPDNIVKKEIYEQHIKDKYNVILVFDDRDSVVTMWRSLGLTCFQVAPGNF